MIGSAARLFGVVLTLGSIHVACSPRPAAPLVEDRAAEHDTAELDGVLDRFASMYVEPSAVAPDVMLDGAMAELEESVPGFSFRSEGDTIEIELGGRRTRLPREARDLDELSAALATVVEWIGRDGDGPAPVEVRAAALRGAVRAVDRWGGVLEGRRREAMLDRFQGTMAGVGCRIGRRDEAVSVLEVHRGGPASRAGLRVGDRLLAIDGRPVAGESIATLVGRLRGDPGTEVTIRVARPEPLDLTITRARFVVPTVSSRMIDGGVGVLRITHVAKNSGIAARRALGGLLESSTLKGVVLDLRGNSGGSMLAAGQIADQFVDQGVLIETRGRDGRPVAGLRHRIDATAAGAPRQVALAVLVDARTGSSAEFLAAALVGRDRAILVGERTFGKGVLQKTYDFGDRDELLLKVTVARAFAAGRPIPADGLVPDVVLQAGEPPEGAVQCRPAIAGPVAVVTLGAVSDQGDAQLAYAARLVERQASLSRREARANIRRELCDGIASPRPGGLALAAVPGNP